MIKALLIVFLPVSGCISGGVRDTERGTWPTAYTEQDRYYVIAWREQFIVKPGPVVWREIGHE